MTLVRSALGLSKPAELARIDRRIDEREARLRAIDDKVRAELAGNPGYRRRRATDR